MRETENRSVYQALAVYLFWLKTGLDQENIATIFGIENRRLVSHYLNQVKIIYIF